MTDATKRALRTFGNLLGNCLYDKEYTKEVVKMRVPPVSYSFRIGSQKLRKQAKFNQNELERRPEFAPPPQQPEAGPSRPPQPAVTTTNNAPPAHAAVPPAPPSPLRTVEEADMSDINMTDVFDGEFLDAGGESFYDIVDQPAQYVNASRIEARPITKTRAD